MTLIISQENDGSEQNFTYLSWEKLQRIITFSYKSHDKKVHIKKIPLPCAKEWCHGEKSLLTLSFFEYTLIFTSLVPSNGSSESFLQEITQILHHPPILSMPINCKRL